MKKSDLPFFERLYQFIFRKIYKNTTCIIKCDRNKLKYNRIIFYLNYPKHIHFGDTLWFEPIVRSFVNTYQNVFVYPSKHMLFYFKELGYNVIENVADIYSNDLLVTRTNLAYYLRGRSVIFLNFSYEKIEVKLIDCILSHLKKSLEINVGNARPLSISYSSEALAQLFNKLKLDANSEYIIFNNYMDSFDLQLDPEYFSKSRCELNEFCMHFKRNNPKYKFIYVGSQKDFEYNSALPDFIDFDLRGQSSVEELFMLVYADQIKYYIGYDTLPMHIFNLYGKDNYIKLRPGYSENYNIQVEKFVAIPFSCATNKITFIH